MLAQPQHSNVDTTNQIISFDCMKLTGYSSCRQKIRMTKLQIAQHGVDVRNLFRRMILHRYTNTEGWKARPKSHVPHKDFEYGIGITAENVRREVNAKEQEIRDSLERNALYRDASDELEDELRQRMRLYRRRKRLEENRGLPEMRGNTASAPAPDVTSHRRQRPRALPSYVVEADKRALPSYVVDTHKKSRFLDGSARSLRE